MEPRPAPVQGSVVSFDDHRGYGVVRAEDGRELFFHCTAVADGTRTIEAGTPVTFVVVPGHLGRYEATDVSEMVPTAGSGDVDGP